MSGKKKGNPEVVVSTTDTESPTRPRRPQYVLPSVNVELTISAHNLQDRDKLSRSDPICVVYVTKPYRKHWVEYARTEVLPNTFNPQWNTKISIKYNFEERQSLMFKIYDWDKESNAWKDQDFLGMLDCSLGEIVSAPGRKFIRKLAVPHLPLGSDTNSTITIVVEPVSETTVKEVVGFRLSGINLVNRGMLAKHDPYLVISKLLEDGTWSVVHKTEVVENTRNPNWRYFSVRMSALGGRRDDRMLRWSVLYWSHHGPPKLVGEFQGTFPQLFQAFQDGKAKFPLINSRKKEKHKSYTHSGLLHIQELRIDEKKSFIEYLQSGLQLQWTVLIDFSSHNKGLKSPTSYHYLDEEEGNNRYVVAIKSVGDVLQDYDADKKFPAYMFGSKPTKDSLVHQYFPLNYNQNNPNCDGVDGILKAYYEALKKVQISSPAIFSESIKQIAKLAKADQNGDKYFVLLILTRGIINDKTATIEAIIAASGLPMSIIIICVGDNNFESMQELDSDGRLLQLNGKKAQRDIVQAVDFKRFMSYTRDQRGNKVPFVRKRALAAEVLAELPYQVVNWLECFRPMESTSAGPGD